MRGQSMKPGRPAQGAILRTLAEAVVDAADSDAIADALVAAVRAGIAVDRVHIVEVSQDFAVGHTRTTTFEGEEAISDRYVQVLDGRPSAAARVVASGEIVHVEDARHAEDIRTDLVERFNAGSILFLPVSWDGEVRYVVILIRTEIAPFGTDEIELAGALSAQAASGYARDEVLRRAAAQHDRDAALARAAKALNATLDLQHVLETIAREAGLAVGGDMAGVYLGDGVRGGIATAGHNTPDDWLGFVIKPGEGVGGQVLATGKPAISNAYQSDVQLPTNPGLRQLQTAVAVPLTWGPAPGELRGALSIGFARMHRIGEEDLRTLEAIADLATVACRNAEAFQRIESAARIDSLTGLLDHSALQRRLREEIARARREGSALSVIRAGPRRLRGCSTSTPATCTATTCCAASRPSCPRSFRPYDGLARYGGDQFAAVLPRCQAPQAAELAERLRRVLLRASWSRRARAPGRRRSAWSVGPSRPRPPSCSTARWPLRDAKRGGKGRVRARLTPLSGASRARVGDQRDRVGQPRSAVEAAEAGDRAGLRLRGLVGELLALFLGPAGAPRVVVAEADRERRGPGRDGERHDIALLDVERAAERELDGLAEVRPQLLRRAGARDARVEFLAWAQDRDPGRGRRRRSSRRRTRSACPSACPSEMVQATIFPVVGDRRTAPRSSPTFAW